MAGRILLVGGDEVASAGMAHAPLRREVRVLAEVASQEIPADSANDAGVSIGEVREIQSVGIASSVADHRSRTTAAWFERHAAQAYHSARLRRIRGIADLRDVPVAALFSEPDTTTADRPMRAFLGAPEVTASVLASVAIPDGAARASALSIVKGAAPLHGVGGAGAVLPVDGR